MTRAPRTLPSPDPRLVLLLRRAVLLGAAMVVAVPAARGANPWLGAWPLWLVAMPLASLWALRVFRLPRWPRAAADPVRPRRRRAPQARRWRQYPAPPRAPAASSRPGASSAAARPDAQHSGAPACS